ncbi:MAG: cupin [Dehalococcoidia bacterium]|nr:cupin [Dehalococcoidia bacterium]
MIEAFAPVRTDKPWGYELLLAQTGQYVGKILHVTAGNALSLQYHREKDETIYLHAGRAVMHYHDDAGVPGNRPMLPGHSFHVPPGSVHRIEALADCDFFEVSTPQLDDVVRLEDCYGRSGTIAP